MREIKFRAWNKKLHGMYTTFAIAWNGKMLGANGFGAWEELSSDKDNYILMQFTGLKDKNGKEIYEGDIVKLKDRNCYVEWRDCGFALRKNDSKGKAWEYNGNLKGYCNGLWGGPPEVIGDIYSSPDLLK